MITYQKQSRNYILEKVDVLNIVQSLLSKKDRSFLALKILEEADLEETCGHVQLLIKSKNPEVRALAIGLVARKRCADAVSILLNALRDKDFLVRTAAVEGLGLFTGHAVYDGLAQSLSDKSSFVRSYSALSLCRIKDVRVPRLLDGSLESEKKPEVKLSLHTALYTLGKKDSLSKLLDYLSHDDYKLRCAAANNLGEFTKAADFESVKEALSKRLKIERTVASKSSVCNAIEVLVKKYCKE